MNEDDAPEEVRHYGLIALAVLMILAGLTVSARPIWLSDAPQVLRLAELPADARLGAVRLQEADLPFLVQRIAVRPAWYGLLHREARDSDHVQPAELGYSVHVVSMLGLPFYGYTDAGYMLYRDRPSYLEVAPLGDEGMAELERRTGRTLKPGGLLPWWRVAWGWIAVAAVAAFGWLEWKRQVRRRQALGLI